MDEVDLVLEFEQSHEMKKTTLDRTVYTYSPDKMYSDAVEAFENGFKGYTTVITEDQYNPTQNSNTDIWYRPDNAAAREQYANEPEKYFIHENQIDVVDGKLYFEEDGKYRIYLRGRTNCALYFSIDGQKYELGATIKTTIPASAQFRLNDSNTYFDVEFKEGACTATVYVNDGHTYTYQLTKDGTGQIRNWVYLKEILIDTSVGAVSYIGVGFNSWTQAMFSAAETYHDASGKKLDSADDEKYSYTQLTYSNLKGTAVAATRTYKDGAVKNYAIKNGTYTETTLDEVARLTKSELTAPTSAAYATAYRNSYEFKNQEFTPDYFYTRSYPNSNYVDNVSAPKDAVTVTETNYKPEGWGNGMPITNVTDGKTNTYIHTSWQVSAKNPLRLTFDLGDERSINRITFICRNNNGMLETPRDFTIEGSLDGVAFFTVGEYTDAPRNGNVVEVNFSDTTLRYCRIVISAAHQNNGNYYIVIGEVTFTHANEVTGGEQYSPDNEIFHYYGKWSLATAHSNFGHVYVGKKGASVEFEFEGSRLGVISSNSLGQKFEVYIDGKKIESIALKQDDGSYRYSYISPELKEGKHKVKIKCKGEANFDSFVVFP